MDENIFDNVFLDDDPDVLDIIDFGFPRRVYHRSNYYEEMDNLTFFQRFRLRKPTVFNSLQVIENELNFLNVMNNCVSPMNQLLTTLRFYATNGHLSSVADFMGMHISTASRIIYRVSRALARLAPLYIKMPQMPEILQNQNDFFQMASFPKVIGCVDGTHIKIQSPGGEDAEIFRNRKGYFSLNTQVVGNSKLKIMNIVSRWPGSAHDQTVFMNSRIRARFEAGEFPNTVLLGDGGYAIQPYLLTPIVNPNTRAEQRFNESHIRTRNTIERLFGTWKRRFPVLAYGLRCKLETAMMLIVSTAVLHNIAIDANEGEPPPPENLNEEEFNYLVHQGQIPDVPNVNIVRGGFNYRNELVQNYFANL